MRRKLIWKFLFFMGLCPFIAPFFYYVLQLLVHNHYSWTLLDMLVLWSFVYWPTYLIGLIWIVLSAGKLKR